MSFETLFHHYWWLIFPIFGMVMAFFGMFQEERRSTQAMDLIKAYVDQGKEPPPELLKLAADGGEARSRTTPRENRVWSFVTFAAVGTGLGLGYYFNQDESWAWVFLIGAVTMGIMAAGALLLLVTQKS